MLLLEVIGERNMSHISTAKTQIKHPDPTLLQRAVEVVAGQQLGEVTGYYLDWNMRKQQTSLALFVPNLKRGMAVVVDPTTGELQFVGDFYGVQPLVSEIQGSIIQTYTSLAVMQALAAQGYVVEAQEGTNGQVVLTGVTHA